MGVLVVAISVLAVGWAWWQSKRETDEMRQMDEEFARSVADETATAKSAH